jgi:hypothetical protein
MGNDAAIRVASSSGWFANKSVVVTNGVAFTFAMKISEYSGVLGRDFWHSASTMIVQGSNTWILWIYNSWFYI